MDSKTHADGHFHLFPLDSQLPNDAHEPNQAYNPVNIHNDPSDQQPFAVASTTHHVDFDDAHFHHVPLFVPPHNSSPTVAVDPALLSSVPDHDSSNHQVNQAVDISATENLFAYPPTISPSVLARNNNIVSSNNLEYTNGIANGTANGSMDAFPPLNANLGSDKYEDYTSPLELVDSLEPLGLPAHSSVAATAISSPTVLSPSLQRHTSSPHMSPHSPHFPPQQNNALHQIHSRNASLTPSSALFGFNGTDWALGSAFQGHRRQFSDAHSDVSSAQHSPYVPLMDSVDQAQDYSPHLAAQDPAMYHEAMGISHMSINEPLNPHISPLISAHPSPGLQPTHSPHMLAVDNNALQALDDISGLNAFSVPQSSATQSQFASSPMFHTYPPMPVFQHSVSEPFPTLGSSLEAAEDNNPPTQFHFTLTTPSRQPTMETEHVTSKDKSTLSPPERVGRGRRNTAPSTSGRIVRASSAASVNDSLSPHAAGVGSRSPSPLNAKGRRASTTNLAPSRDKILDLADKNRPSSTHSDRRPQKYPANFQCTLCPKRFTRAYNLRSHLRTHTDERPYLCSVCGNGFARRHDCKRHEALHSGEKRFICEGVLKTGNPWGCKRRFARADALGRHFRSDAGRTCIRPLMDEEIAETALKGMSQHAQVADMLNMPGGAIMSGISLPSGVAGSSSGSNIPMIGGQGHFAFSITAPGVDYNADIPTATSPVRPAVPSSSVPTAMQDSVDPRFTMLPKALCEQYPALKGWWDSMPVVPESVDDAVDPGDGYDDTIDDVEVNDGRLSGRGSFSSAGDIDDEEWRVNVGQALVWRTEVGS